MENLFNVHEEWDHIIVPARGHQAFYRVVYGAVSWTQTADDLRPAIVVFMQDDDTEDFAEAKAAGVIRFRMTAHILLEDVEDVAQAMRSLVRRNQKK